MANLGNSKIKDTYQLVLQTDAGGNLQKLDGSTPNPFIINQNLRYLDGTTHPSGYVLMSDGSGNASWGAVAFSGDIYISGGSIEGTTIELRTTSGNTVSIPGLKWSANTDGSISPSGLTTSIGIGTSTPNKPLTVVGDISGTTDLYLGSSTHTASTITAEETLTIKGNGLNDFLYLANDRLDMYMDGAQLIEMTPTGIVFNASSDNIDFNVKSEDGTQLIRTRAERNIVRLLDYVSINKPTGWNWENEQKQALAVSGTSVFYSGGTNHPNEAIVAIGNISGTTDLYLGSSSHTTSNIIAQEELIIKGHGAGNDYLKLNEDNVDIFINGAECISIQPNQITINSSTQDIDTKIMSQTNGTAAFHVDANTDIVRLNRYIQINGESMDTNQALYVSGSSLFYSGGSNNTNPNAITAVGDISGAGRTYIGTIDAAGASYSNNKLLVAQSNGEVEYLTTAELKADIADADYWSGNTDGSISPSGNTDVRISGNTYVSGDAHTTNLVLAAGGYIMPAASSNTIKMRAQNYDGEMLSVGPDLLQVNMNSAANFQITPTQVTFNSVGVNQSFRIRTDTGNFTVESDGVYDLLTLMSQGGTSIGGTTKRWPTDSGYAGTAPNKTLQVNGRTTIYSGGTGNSWSADTTALTVVGNISGTTNLYVDDDIYSGTTNLLDIFSNNSGTVTSVTGTAPVVSSGGNTPAISVTTAAVTNGSVNLSTGDQIYDFVAGFTAPAANRIAVTDDETSDTTFEVPYGAAPAASVSLLSSSRLTYNPYDANLTSTNFTGALVGNSSTSTKIGSITNNDIVQLTDTQTLTNKTLTTPIISSISNTGTITLPTSTDTLVGKATTDTLTNKTLTSPVFNTGISGTAFLDEDDMASNSADKVASQQSIKSYINSTRMDWMKTTGGIKLLSSDNWVGFNRTTGGLDSSGFWNADCGGTTLSDVHAFYGSYFNTMFTAPYGGYLKRLIIQGANTTNAGAVGEDWNIYLAKSPVVNDSDSISWSQVTGFTRTLPDDRNKRFIYDIPLNGTTGVAISQYDTFLLAFQGTNATTTWITANIILEFEYEI